MAVREAYLYEHPDLPGAWESLRNSLMRVGLGLIQPGLEMVTELHGEGEPVYISEEDFEQHAQTDADLSFQWWFTERESVYCRIRVRQAIRIIYFGMEGCDDDQLRAIGSALLERVTVKAEATIGFVFDPVGFTEDYDWDRFFVDKERLDCRQSFPDFPDVLVVTARDLDRVSNVPDEILHVRQRGLVILSRGTVPLPAPHGC